MYRNTFFQIQETTDMAKLNQYTPNPNIEVVTFPIYCGHFMPISSFVCAKCNMV